MIKIIESETNKGKLIIYRLKEYKNQLEPFEVFINNNKEVLIYEGMQIDISLQEGEYQIYIKCNDYITPAITVNIKKNKESTIVTKSNKAIFSKQHVFLYDNYNLSPKEKRECINPKTNPLKSIEIVPLLYSSVLAGLKYFTPVFLVVSLVIRLIRGPEPFSLSLLFSVIPLSIATGILWGIYNTILCYTTLNKELKKYQTVIKNK
ncbi:hypothetical protein EDC18_101459 [Natranaerovirga pectinivora]|uniref:Uncharacterized protein n=1 Tax=Natranaerovirga pectinivora TaxID=682400 RepID=A0A4R3MPJ9_9FIRM|nr:hypothetical protein [Natranaerovirga pectinivora]TCT17161.1 hypothetical protein EDC18_101459 [Natranaerovirga pectinivora]